jgi:hypothetical protein
MNNEIRTTRIKPFPDVPWQDDRISCLVHTYFDLLFDHQINGYQDIKHFILYEPHGNNLSINFLLRESKLEELKQRGVIKELKEKIDTPPGKKYLLRENVLLQGLNLQGEMFSFAGEEPETTQIFLIFHRKS